MKVILMRPYVTESGKKLEPRTTLIVTSEMAQQLRDGGYLTPPVDEDDEPAPAPKPAPRKRTRKK